MLPKLLTAIALTFAVMTSGQIANGLQPAEAESLPPVAVKPMPSPSVAPTQPGVIFPPDTRTPFPLPGEGSPSVPSPSEPPVPEPEVPEPEIPVGTPADLTAESNAIVRCPGYQPGEAMVNFRQAPGLSSPVIAQLHCGTPVAATTKEVLQDDIYWKEVRWRSLQGWVATPLAISFF